MKILIKLVLLINVFVSNIQVQYNWGHFLLPQIRFWDIFCLFASLDVLYKYRILHSGTKIWILSSSGQDNTLRTSVANE